MSTGLGRSICENFYQKVLASDRLPTATASENLQENLSRYYLGYYVIPHLVH